MDNNTQTDDQQNVDKQNVDKQNVHIVPREEGWAVLTENSDRAVKIHETQEDAITHGKELAEQRESEILIHGSDGQIRERYSYTD